MTRSITARAAAALLGAASVAAAVPTAGPSAAPPALGDRCIVVTANSDLHGSLEPQVLEAGSARVRRGGLLAQAAYVAALRERFGQRVVLLDGGDLYQGTFASNLSRGEAVIAAYSALGWTATAVGNHEFDYGPTSPTSRDRLGVLKQRIEQATFPFVALNIFEDGGARPVGWARRSVLVDAGAATGGVRIGIVGAATVETPKVTHFENVRHLTFPSPVGHIIAESRRLRAAGADLVVLTAHIGGMCERFDDPLDTSSCRPDSELFELLKALPPGVLDVAVGGHTHRHVAHVVNGVIALQNGARGQTLSWAEVCARPGGGLDLERSRVHLPLATCLDTWSDGTGCEPRTDEGKAKARANANAKAKAKVSARPATLWGEPLAIPQEIQQAVAPYLDAARVRMAEPLGVRLPAPLARDEANPAAGAPRLGDLVAQAMREAAQTDLAVQNLGGVRADLPAGPLTFGQVYEVLPFGNRIGKLTLTGAQVRHLVETLIARRDAPPYLAGLRVERRGAGWHFETEAGPLRPEGLYTLATSDFLVAGGEGLGSLMEALPEQRRIVMETTLREALTALLRRRFGG